MKSGKHLELHSSLPQVASVKPLKHWSPIYNAYVFIKGGRFVVALDELVRGIDVE